MIGPKATRPKAYNADGSAVCQHRDLSVCSACASADWRYIDVYGAHYYSDDRAYHAEMTALMAPS